MDALPPSLPNTGPPQPVSAATAGLAILLAELTEALAKLPANTQLAAQVVRLLPLPLPSPLPAEPGAPLPPATAPTGTLVQISTPDGPAQIRLPPQIQVAPGARLEIAIVQGGAQPQWRLLALDGKPMGPAGPLAPPAASGAPSATAPVQTAAPVQIGPRPPPSPGIPATVIASASPALPSGTTLMVRITSLTPPSQSAPPAADTQPAPEPEAQTEVETETEPATAPETPLATSPTPAPAPVPVPAAVAPEAGPSPAPSPAAGTPSPAPAPTAAPTSIAAPTVQQPPTAPVPAAPAAAAPPTVQSPIMPEAGPAPPSPPVAAQGPAVPAPTAAPLPDEVGGQVLPNTDGGKTLVRTPIGLLSLDSGPQTLPPDSAVTLQVVGKPAPPLLFPPPPPPAGDPPEHALPRRLAQLVATVQASGNEALAEAVREKIPAPGPKLAAQILAAVASAQAQQPGLARFLGDGIVSALTHAAPQAAEALARHWESAAPAVQGPGDGDWRTLMIPFLMEGQMTTIRLTARHRQGKMAAAEREKGTRFLLDLDLSRLGPMQFDGLVKRQHKRFDLILRTAKPLPGEMRRDIDALFLNGLLNFGLEGSISFQPEGRFVTAQRLSGETGGTVFA